MPSTGPIIYNTESNGAWMMNDATFRIISGVLAVVCLVLIILRRRNKRRGSDQDDL